MDNGITAFKVIILSCEAQHTVRSSVSRLPIVRCGGGFSSGIDRKLDVHDVGCCGDYCLPVPIDVYRNGTSGCPDQISHVSVVNLSEDKQKVMRSFHQELK